MAEARQPSRPPSEPKLAPRPLVAGDPLHRPMHIHLFLAMLGGLVIVATVLYLWRRPTAASESLAASKMDPSSSSMALADAGATSSNAADASITSVVLSAPRTIGCHDRGSKKTAPEDCDHLSEIEQAFTRAVEQSAGCAQSSSETSVDYLVDVSFLRKRIVVASPKEKRASHRTTSAKAASSCMDAVRRGLSSVSIDNLPHEHARYKIAITATYPGTVKP